MIRLFSGLLFFMGAFFRPRYLSFADFDGDIVMFKSFADHGEFLHRKFAHRSQKDVNLLGLCLFIQGIKPWLNAIGLRLVNYENYLSLVGTGFDFCFNAVNRHGHSVTF
jgi:hypothetical protein